METLPDPVTFEASGLPCVILMTVPGNWLACVEITRGHGQTLPEKNASIVCNEQLSSALETAVEEIRDAHRVENAGL